MFISHVSPTHCVAQDRQRLLGQRRRPFPFARGHRDDAVRQDGQRNRVRVSDARGQRLRLLASCSLNASAASDTQPRAADSIAIARATRIRLAGIERHEQMAHAEIRPRSIMSTSSSPVVADQQVSTRRSVSASISSAGLGTKRKPRQRSRARRHNSDSSAARGLRGTRMPMSASWCE